MEVNIGYFVKNSNLLIGFTRIDEEVKLGSAKTDIVFNLSNVSKALDDPFNLEILQKEYANLSKLIELEHLNEKHVEMAIRNIGLPVNIHFHQPLKEEKNFLKKPTIEE